MKKVITYGTYDLFHRGHYNMLKRAKEAGDYLIVGVTGDNYDIGRGKLSVRDSLATRIENVRNTGFADEIIVEEYLGQKISDIIEYDIDAFVIGDDWKGKFDHLNAYCNVIYLERTKNISSTQLREENFKTYNIGILTDINDDNQIVRDSKLVTGYNVIGVYSENTNLADDFKDKYGLDEAYNSLDKIVEDSDIIFIRNDLEKRYDLIKLALTNDKHVICDPPFTLSVDKERELFDIAKEHNVILMENVKMVHINVFNQLLWMTRGGLIGDIIKFNCAVSKNDKNIDDLFYDLMALALCPVIKIMGSDYKSLHIKNSRGIHNIEFSSVIIGYDTGEAVLNVGNQIRVANEMEIIGTKGTIRLKNNWWKANYFELEKVGSNTPEFYNMNFEGNGFKFLLKHMYNMLKNGKIESLGLKTDESVKIIEILEKIEKEN